MPTYEFRCPAGHDFEKFYRKISDAPAEVACPQCGEIAARQLSAGGLLFKGSGFYITDYGKDGKGARKPTGEGAAGGDKKSDAASGSSSGESAPAKGESASTKAATDSRTGGGKSGGSGGKSGGTSGGTT